MFNAIKILIFLLCLYFSFHGFPNILVRYWHIHSWVMDFSNNNRFFFKSSKNILIQFFIAKILLSIRIPNLCRVTYIFELIHCLSNIKIKMKFHALVNSI